MRQRARRRIRILGGVIAVLCGLAPLASAQGVDTVEGLILTTARAQALVRSTLNDSVAPIGNLLNQIGPSSLFAAGEQGFGHWSLALGVSASEFSVTSPDYTLDDPGGSDRIEGGIGSFNIDASLGLFRGYQPSESVTTAGSIDLLLRLGFSLGDQENLSEEIDFSSWAPILGAGLRIGLLKGPRLPAVSLAAGVNYFQRRNFTVQIEDDDATVDLDFQQTSTFLLLEVGKSFSWITPYLVVGLTHHRLEADYEADIVIGTDQDPAVTIDDDVDDKQGINVFFGGVEFGSGLLRLDLEAGTADSEPFGRFFIRFAG